jgi:large repetitive protein
MRTLSALFALLLLACLAGCPTTPDDDDDAGLDDDDVSAIDDDDSGALDADEDGWPGDLDCDDDDPDAFPGAQEVCDEIDNDCDGLTDEDAVDAPTWYGDSDGDGFGGDLFEETACDQPADHVADNDDCNDLSASTNPDADEVCDGDDNDCDGEVDEDDAVGAPVWFHDSDGDGYGLTVDTVTACDAPPQYAAHDGDCDDGDPAWHPGAAEADCSDPNDYNCDGSTGYADVDGDGFAACEDCDDAEPLANPDGVEICDLLDNDCDGVINDAATDAATWWADADGDGYGGATLSLVQCDQPVGYLLDSSDCDDLDATSNPDGVEVCDEADNDCDTDVDEGVGVPWYADDDGDGYGDPGDVMLACFAPAGRVGGSGDCDDAEPTTNPASWEICDGVDNDCDTDVDEADAINASTFFVDWDGDGYGGTGQVTTACDPPTGFADNQDDCDDSDPGINPDALELCDSEDNDCDGQVDEDDAAGAADWWIDADLDGWGSLAAMTVACDQPFGYTDNSDDCDDSDPASTTIPEDGDCDGTLFADDCDDADPASTIIAEDGDCDGTPFAADCDDADPASTIIAEDEDCDGTPFAADCDDTDPASTVIADDADCDTFEPPVDCDDTDPTVYPGAPELADGLDNDCNGIIDDSSWTGVIEMPAADTVDGFSGGPWAPMNGDGRIASRVVLTQGCENPQLAFYQHPTADSSIHGSYYVMDASGGMLAFSTFETYIGCNDCWLPHAGRLAVTMTAGATYYLGFQNGTGMGDMSGPSIYMDDNPRTVGIATFDDPRADQPGADIRGLAPTSVNWQHRWRIDCE